MSDKTNILIPTHIDSHNSSLLDDSMHDVKNKTFSNRSQSENSFRTTKLDNRSIGAIISHIEKMSKKNQYSKDKFYNKEIFDPIVTIIYSDANPRVASLKMKYGKITNFVQTQLILDVLQEGSINKQLNDILEIWEPANHIKENEEFRSVIFARCENRSL